jgi:acetolactate synthase small subunit
MQQKEKLNELIGAIHEKDELLDNREEFLIKENKRHVKVKNAYAQEVEKNENLTKELSISHDTISNLRTENASLNAKVEKLNACNDSIANLRNENASLISKAKDLNVCNDAISCLRDENAMLKYKIDELIVCKPSTSTVAHVTICTRCRDVNVDAIHDQLALIKQQNDHVAQLTTKINEHEIENEKFKLRMALVSNREAMSSLMPLRNCLTLLRAKISWFRITRATFYILLVIPNTKLGEFMLRNLIQLLTMLFCIRMRHLALGNQPMLNCLRIKLLLHQMSLTFHLRLLMHFMCLLTN